MLNRCIFFIEGNYKHSLKTQPLKLSFSSFLSWPFLPPAISLFVGGGVLSYKITNVTDTQHGPLDTGSFLRVNTTGDNCKLITLFCKICMKLLVYVYAITVLFTFISMDEIHCRDSWENTHLNNRCWKFLSSQCIPRRNNKNTSVIWYLIYFLITTYFSNHCV